MAKTIVSTEELVGKIAEPQILSTEELFGKKPSLISQIKTVGGQVVEGFKDVPAQIQDLLTATSRILFPGLKQPPFVSKLVTETIPYLAEKATTPIGEYKIPSTFIEPVKALIQKRPMETTAIQPTPLDIAWYGMMGKAILQNQIALHRWNSQISKLIKTEEVRGAVMENMPAFENLMTQVGIKVKEMDLEQKTNFILNQARRDPKVGTAVMDLVQGRIGPRITPIMEEPTPVPMGPTPGIVTTEELTAPTVQPAPTPIVPPIAPQVPKVPIPEVPGHEPQYSISKEEYNSVFDGGIGITPSEKPKVIPPVTATNETITFPKEGGRHIAEIYEREIGPVLQMSKRMRKWLGVYYGGLGKGSGLIRVKTLENLDVLAHETGHFLDDVLHKYPIEKDQRAELIAVAKFRTLFEEKYIIGISPKTGKVTKQQDYYTAYRKRREELFADYVSAYITDPDKVKELAPIFTAQIEREILKDKEFAWVITKMREYNAEFQILKDYITDLRNIPQIQPLLKTWAEQGNLLQNLWRNKIGDPIWNLVSSTVDRIGKTPAGRLVTEKKGLDDVVFEVLRQRKHLIDGQSAKVMEELVTPISKMSKEDQEYVNDALQRFEILVPIDEKNKLTEAIRKELALWGNEARKLGLLSDMSFWDKVGQYFPWFYETKEFDENKAKFGIGISKALRINLQSYKHRLSDEEMGRKVLESQMGTWPSQKAKIAEYSKEELIAIGKKTREEMKLMKTVAYPLQKRVRMLINSVYTCKALNSLANLPGVIGNRQMAGYVQLPEGKSLGNLSGQYVPDNLYREINQFNYKADELLGGLEVLVGVWKTFKVPYDPAAVARNAVTNMIALWMGDVPTWNPAVVIKGANSFIRKDATYQLLRDHGLYKHTYAQEELESLAFIMETEPETKLENIVKWAVTVFDTPGRIYGAIEDASKTIGAAYILSQGGTAEQAVKFADKWLFDYSSVSKAVSGARKLPWPFITWSAKIFPRLVETAIRKPEKMLFVWLLLLLGTAYARKRLGITQKEEESMKPDYLKGKWTLLMPERDKNGQVQWIDLTYYMPWGGWTTQIKGSLVPQPLQMGNPFMTLYNAYVQNYDPFSGEIGKEWMTEEEQRQAKNKYVLQSLAPSMIFGRAAENIYNAIKPPPDRPPTELSKVLTGEILGLKTITGGETSTRVVNYMSAQRRTKIEVNRRAKLAWEEYFRNPTPENNRKAIEANMKVKVADRQRIKMKAKKDVRFEKDRDRRLKELSGPERGRFRKYERTLLK